MAFLKKILTLGLLLLLLSGSRIDMPVPLFEFEQQTSYLRDAFAGTVRGQQRTFETAPADQAAAAVSDITPAVVTVYGYAKEEAEYAGPSEEADFSGLENLFSFLGNARERLEPATRVSAGSGFFVDESGYIITNRHVVDEEDADYTVVLENGKRRSAEVVYRDAKNDLAVLKISGSDYPVVPLGDSSKLKVGTTVVGIGNAYGRYPNTVSLGSVSGLRRTIVAPDGEESQRLTNLIQTNAQLFPGYSGGPLLNENGEVIGINVAIAADRPNLSFSIPINDAKTIIKTITES